MTQLIETATFAELELKIRGKFENVNTPLLIMPECTAPFGADLDSIYSPLPSFAGGTDARKHLTMQLEISEAAAKGFELLDAACSERSTMTGKWVSLVRSSEGRFIIKVRINVEGARPTAFRVGEGALQTGWEHLGPILAEHSNLRGHSLKVALCPQYIWSVSGNRGLTMSVEQFVVQARAPVVRIDHFA
jgi:hypothetical protein